jgi:hypothetical protein
MTGRLESLEVEYEYGRCLVDLHALVRLDVVLAVPTVPCVVLLELLWLLGVLYAFVEVD